MCSSCYLAGYAEAVFHRMGYIFWDGSPYLGYCRYSWADDSILDYDAHGNHHVQQAPPRPGRHTVAAATTGSGTPQVAQHDSGTGPPSSVETVPESGSENTPRAAALLVECSVLFRVPRIGEAATANRRTL